MLFAVAAALLPAVNTARGQGLTSSSNPTLAIAAPAETQYDAGVSGPTPAYSITTNCTASSGPACRLFIQYSASGQGQPLAIEYAIVSLTARCTGATANPNAWYAIQPATAVLSTARSRSCVASFRFRVNPLAWNVHTAPGPSSGRFWQRVNFVLTRP